MEMNNSISEKFFELPSVDLFSSTLLKDSIYINKIPQFRQYALAYIYCCTGSAINTQPLG